MPMHQRHFAPAHTPFFNSAGLARTSTGLSMDDAKAFLEKESLGVSGLKNKYVLALAAAGGLLWYGYKKRWF